MRWRLSISAVHDGSRNLNRINYRYCFGLSMNVCGYRLVGTVQIRYGVLKKVRGTTNEPKAPHNNFETPAEVSVW